jgi:acyl carrier protein
LTANGKIDRNALPDPGTSRPQLETPYEAPGTAVEMSLVKIWADVLNLSTVGIHDDFVALGGHSLLAARIVAKINEVFGIEVSIRSLLDVSTVAGLAGLVNALIESKKNAERIAGRAAIDEESGEL